MSTSIITPIFTPSTSISTPIFTSTTLISTTVSRTSSSTTTTAAIRPSTSAVYPGLSPTSYTTGGSAVPSPSASCLPRFEALNLTIIINSNTLSTTNLSPAFSEAFVKCCSPQPVFVYGDTCLLYCPFYANPGESQSNAGARFSDCLRGFGQVNSLAWSISKVNGTTPIGAVQTATGDGSRPTGLAAPTKFAAPVLAGLPLLAGLMGAILV